MNITTREKEVLYNLSEGLSSKEIGRRLYISEHTVETHKRNLMIKLRARNTVHLVIMAERQGWNNLKNKERKPEDRIEGIDRT